eukprot:scaffold157_cov255-Prasinococcus_capsulatus_cf.AAC.5
MPRGSRVGPRAAQKVKEEALKVRRARRASCRSTNSSASPSSGGFFHVTCGGGSTRPRPHRAAGRVGLGGRARAPSSRSARWRAASPR